MIEIQMIGNVGDNAVIREFGGKKYLSFSVAETYKYTNAEGVPCEKTTWVSCLKPLADDSKLAAYIRKGAQVFVRGKLTVKIYTDGNGRPCAGLDCAVSTLQLCGGKRDDGNVSAAPIDEQQRPQPAAPQMIENENELPF